MRSPRSRRPAIHPGGLTAHRGEGVIALAARRVVDVVRRTIERFFALEGFDRAMALAGQAFAAFLPLLMVINAVAPTQGDDAADGIIDKLELSGESADVVRAVVAQPAAIEDGVSALSFLVLILSALAFTRALQRLYVRAWGLEKIGVRGNVWGLLWLLAFAAYGSLQPLILSIFSGDVATAVSLVTSSALWLFTPWLLVGRQIHWHRLVPQALLTSVSLALLGVAASIYMPRTVASAAAQFGFIGVAFALLSFLFVAAFILVTTAALGSTLAEPTHDRGEVATTPSV